MTLRLLVFLGSNREGRKGENVAKCMVNLLKEKGHDVELIDPLTVGFDGHIHQPMHFQRDQSKVPKWMVETNKKIQDAHGYVIVTPEYNCSLPPALTGLMDHFPPASYRHKPCAIISYSIGPFGGVRAAALARPFVCELGMISTPTPCCIPLVTGKFSDEGEYSNLDERSETNLGIVISEIAWYASALSQKKKTDGVPPHNDPKYLLIA